MQMVGRIQWFWLQLLLKITPMTLIQFKTVFVRSRWENGLYMGFLNTINVSIIGPFKNILGTDLKQTA